MKRKPKKKKPSRKGLCTATTKSGEKCKNKARLGKRRCSTHSTQPRAKPAESTDRIRRPYDRDKALSAAYLRLIGATQEQAAKGAGCSERSLHGWEKCSWWAEIVAEARQRWLRKGDALAMHSLLKAFTDPHEYAQHSRWWADRRIKELKPPKLQTELTGKDGGPIKMTWAELVKAAADKA